MADKPDKKDKPEGKKPPRDQGGKPGGDKGKKGKGKAEGAAGEPEVPAAPAPPARLAVMYRETVVPRLREALGRTNPNSLPRLEKICLNMGVGKAIDDSKILDEAQKAMTAVAGQAAVVTKSRTSISNFKLRKGYKIGCRATLRGARMWEFFDRLVSIAIPRIRDFHGLGRKAFDKAGNYGLGIEELTIFPEIDADRMTHAFGMDVNFVIRNARSSGESLAFLKMMGMPFAE